METTNFTHEQYRHVCIAWIFLAGSRSMPRNTHRIWQRLTNKALEECYKIYESRKNTLEHVHRDDFDKEFFNLKQFYDRGTTPGPHHTDKKSEELRIINQTALANAVTSVVEENLRDKKERVNQLKDIYKKECKNRLNKKLKDLEVLRKEAGKGKERSGEIKKSKKQISQLKDCLSVDDSLFELDFREVFDKWLSIKGKSSDSQENNTSSQNYMTLPNPETSLELSGHIYGGRAMQLDELLPELKLESWAFKDEIPPYVERESDEELRSKIREARMSGGQGLVVVRGEPKSGKTRSVFEALQAECPDIPVWWSYPGPESTSLFSKKLIEHNSASPLVIVLDNLNRFTEDKDGLTWYQLEQLRRSALLVVIVHEESMSDLNKSLQGTSHALYQKLEEATVRQEVEFNDKELQKARKYLDKAPKYLEAEKVDIRRYPEFLAAVRHLREKIKNIYREGTADEADYKTALINALTDATIMYPSGINKSQLEQLSCWELEILDAFHCWNPEEYKKATTDWARKPIGKSKNRTHVILVQSPRNTELYKLYDPLVQEQQEKLFQKRGPDTFDFLTEHLDEVEHDVVASIARSLQVEPATRVIWMIRAALQGDKEARLWIRLKSFHIHKVDAAKSMFSHYSDWCMNPSVASAVFDASFAALFQFEAPLKFATRIEVDSGSPEKLLNLLESLEPQYFESEDMIDAFSYLIGRVRGNDAQKEWLKEKCDEGNVYAKFEYFMTFRESPCDERENFESKIFSAPTDNQQTERADALSRKILGHIGQKDIRSALRSLKEYITEIERISSSMIANSTEVDHSASWIWDLHFALVSYFNDSQKGDFIEKSLKLLNAQEDSVTGQTGIRNLYLLLLIEGGRVDDALSFVNRGGSEDIDTNLLLHLSRLLEHDGKHSESFHLLKSCFDAHGWELGWSDFVIQMGIIAKTPLEQYCYNELINEINWNNGFELERFIRMFKNRVFYSPRTEGEKKKAVALLTKHPFYEQFKDKIGALDSNDLELSKRWLSALVSTYIENANSYFTLVEFGSEESKRYAQKIREKLISEITNPRSASELLCASSEWMDDRPFWKACEEDKQAKNRMKEILKILNEVDGQYAEIEYARVYAYDALGETDKAMQCLRKAIALNSPDALLLAWWLEEHGLSLTDNGSEDYLEKAVKAGSFEALIYMADKLLETDEADTIEDHIKACVHHYLDPI